VQSRALVEPVVVKDEPLREGAGIMRIGVDDPVTVNRGAGLIRTEGFYNWCLGQFAGMNRLRGQREAQRNNGSAAVGNFPSIFFNLVNLPVGFGVGAMGRQIGRNGVEFDLDGIEPGVQFAERLGIAVRLRGDGV
jgi:hypothetical protein